MNMHVHVSYRAEIEILFTKVEMQNARFGLFVFPYTQPPYIQNRLRLMNHIYVSVPYKLSHHFMYTLSSPSKLRLLILLGPGSMTSHPPFSFHTPALV